MTSDFLHGVDDSTWVKFIQERFPHNSVVTLDGTMSARVLRPRLDGTGTVAVYLDNVGCIVDVVPSRLTRVGDATYDTVGRKASDPRPSPPEQWNLSKMTHDERRMLNELRRPLDAQVATERGRVERIKKEISLLSLRLSNPEFCERAPKVIVANARERLAQLHDKHKIAFARLEELLSSSVSTV